MVLIFLFLTVSFFKNPLENYTNDPYQREEFTMGISYSDNPQEIIETAEKLLKEFDDIQANPSSSSNC